jgi:hypothetical protein
MATTRFNATAPMTEIATSLGSTTASAATTIGQSRLRIFEERVLDGALRRMKQRHDRYLAYLG